MHPEIQDQQVNLEEEPPGSLCPTCIAIRGFKWHSFLLQEHVWYCPLVRSRLQRRSGESVMLCGKIVGPLAVLIQSNELLYTLHRGAWSSTGLLMCMIAYLSHVWLVACTYRGHKFCPRVHAFLFEQGVPPGVLLALSLVTVLSSHLLGYLTSQMWWSQIMYMLIALVLRGVIHWRLDYMLWCFTIYTTSAVGALYRSYVDAPGVWFPGYSEGCVIVSLLSSALAILLHLEVTKGIATSVEGEYFQEAGAFIVNSMYDEVYVASVVRDPVTLLPRSIAIQPYAHDLLRASMSVSLTQPPMIKPAPHPVPLCFSAEALAAVGEAFGEMSAHPWQEADPVRLTNLSTRSSETENRRLCDICVTPLPMASNKPAQNMFLAVRYRNVSACPGASADPLLEALAPGDPTNSSASDDNQDEVGLGRDPRPGPRLPLWESIKSKSTRGVLNIGAPSTSMRVLTREGHGRQWGVCGLDRTLVHSAATVPMEASHPVVTGLARKFKAKWSTRNYVLTHPKDPSMENSS